MPKQLSDYAGVASGSPIRQPDDTVLRIAEIMGIDKDTAVHGSLRVDVEHNAITVRWEGFALANEIQRQEILDALTQTHGIERVKR